MRDFLLSAGAAFVLVAMPAQAQSQSNLGSVASVTGQPGQVLVARKGQTFTLASDNPLFDKDLVFTNQAGGATLKFSGCTKTLAGSQSITIDAKVCEAVPVNLSNGQVIGGVTIGQAAGLGMPGGAAGVAAVAVLIGGAAAAGAGGGSSSPTSP
jgi:hypothetical protein